MIEAIRQRTLAFVEQNHLPGGIGLHRYSASVDPPTLYSSTYAVMTRSLYNDLDALTSAERDEWIGYLDSHQDDDGLYRDPAIYDKGWYAGDPFWCGRPHLTCHVIAALACLGSVAKKPFGLVHDFADSDDMVAWLEQRDWGDRVAWSGNEIMNLGTILQYARDFHHDARAARPVEVMLDWLSAHHLNAATGLWGDLDVSDPRSLSQAVQAAYHWWPLYFYDGRPIPRLERAIDSILATQNPNGGFGCGVHNEIEPFNSSACEDIDSIDPLARLSMLTDYRRDDVRAALERAAAWVLRNQMCGGGYVFMLDRPFEYGHPALFENANAGGMFPTWFRTLSLALIGAALPDGEVGRYPWHFARCPGGQFEPAPRS